MAKLGELIRTCQTRARQSFVPPPTGPHVESTHAGPVNTAMGQSESAAASVWRASKLINQYIEEYTSTYPES